MSGLKQLFVLLGLAVIASVSDARSPQPIIGGVQAVLGEFPYQVSLRHYGSHICGGSIIDKRHILTAAHCIDSDVSYPYTDIRVVTGTILSWGGKSHAVKSIVSHPKYNLTYASSPNDIAIIELKNDLVFDKNVNKIDLPTEDAISDVDAIATGWGLESSSQRSVTRNLMKITLKTLTHSRCQRYMYAANLFAHQICTLGGSRRGICQGDSGGPLVYDDKVIGIVSFGIPCGLGYPDVYTNVYHYLDWIKKTIASF